MTTPPDPPAADGEGERIRSLNDVIAEQQRQGGVLDELMAFFKGNGNEPPKEPDKPELNIAEEIRRQLDERDKARPKEEPKAPDPKDLAEKPPVAPVRRVTKWMGWADE